MYIFCDVPGFSLISCVKFLFCLCVPGFCNFVFRVLVFGVPVFRRSGVPAFRRSGVPAFRRSTVHGPRSTVHSSRFHRNPKHLKTEAVVHNTLHFIACMHRKEIRIIVHSQEKTRV